MGMKRNYRHHLARWALIVLSTTGFAFDGLSGCSDQNKTTIYGGAEQFAVSMLNAVLIGVGQQQGFTFTPPTSTGSST